MESRLIRHTFTERYTEGDLYLDGAWWAFTLEDAYRDGRKVPGKTCIPPGRYAARVSHSPRFGKRMTEILGVPGFSGVRIHQGLTPGDSLGCPLIGARRGAAPGSLAPMARGSLTDALTERVEAAGPCVLLIVHSETP